MTPNWHSRLSLVFFLLTSALLCFGQDLGGLPGEIDWKVLKSKDVNVITTPAAEAFARRTLTIDEALIELRPLSLGGRIEQIDVVVQNETVVPNGFVGLEPFRSYLYSSPPQQQNLVGTTDWVDELAIHEYRHVEQFANLRRGWTRVASHLFGQGGWSAMIGLTTPDWFFEGDAVVSETTLTYSGRGRTPEFSALQRANALAGKQFAYQKARNGSFRDRVPNHYPLGYALTMHGWLNDKKLWPEVVRKSGNGWPPIYPFSNALKKQTGKSTRAYYKMVYDSLATVWQDELAATKLTRHYALPGLLEDLDIFANPLPVGTWVRETVPTYKEAGSVIYGGAYQLDSNDIVAERKSQVNIRELVVVSPTGKVKSLAGLGTTIDGSMHAAGGKVVWTQLRNHPRRPNQTYAVIMRMDLVTGNKQQITKRTRYYNPGLNSDGSRVVVVEKIPNEPARLKVIFSGAGTIAQEVEEPIKQPFDLIIGPRFTADDQSIIAVAKQKDALAIWRFDVPLYDSLPQTREQLTPWTRHVLGTPYVHRDHVYFSASFTGIDNIFRVRVDGKGEIEQLTNVAVSATQPSVDDQRLYFVEVNALGNPVSVLPRPQWLNKPIQIVEPVDMPRYAHLEFDGASKVFRERFFTRKLPKGEYGVLTTVKQKDIASSSADGKFLSEYKGLLRGFSFYSFQPQADQNQVSGTIFGGNILGDLDSEITIGRNLNEGRNYVNASATLARTWPWVTGSFGTANRSTLYLQTQDTTRLRRSRFLEYRTGVRLLAPFRQDYGEYNVQFRPYAGATYLYFTSTRNERPGTSAIGAGDVGFQLSRLRQVAPKHILPRAGQLLTVRMRRSIYGAAEPAQQITATAGLFLPGFNPVHTLYLRAHARDEALTNNYQFPDFYSYARGYSKTPNGRALGVSADYYFPIAYPDIGALGLVYVSRLRANVWADATRLRLPAQYIDRDDIYASFGIDITMDATFFNVENLPVGVRFAYRFRQDDFRVNKVGFVMPRLLFELPL
ncbi:MAG: hypothetical protein AB8F78_14015 [Saprospiraceae bacterium]